MDVLELIEAQLEKNDRLIAGVADEKLSAPTPCAQFDVRALMNHMVVANHFFVSVASGQPMEGAGDEVPEVLGDDPAIAHGQSAVELMKTLREPGVQERTFNFGFAQMPAAMGLGLMLTETTVHGWDLAKAAGGDTSIDADVATMLLQGSQGIDAMRSPEGNPFGPAVEVPETASPGDRLVAFLGRTP